MSAGTSIDDAIAWADRWRGVLDAAGPSAARRIQRGQALARRGAVSDLDLRVGEVRGSVAEARSHPYQVTITWEPAPRERWDEAAEQLRRELRFTAALLDGTLPADLADALGEVGVHLLPAFADLELSCSCTERAAVCRHVAAVHDAASVLIGRDPVLLLRLAGRDHAVLLRQLRRDPRSTDTTVDVPLDLSHGLEAAQGDLDAIDLRPTPVADPGALLRQLGDPPGVADPTGLEELVERAAAAAWRLAAGDGSDAADEEVLLAELRAQRMATAGSLADSLGRELPTVMDELERLFDAGAVMRTGSGEKAKYRAAGA